MENGRLQLAVAAAEAREVNQMREAGWIACLRSRLAARSQFRSDANWRFQFSFNDSRSLVCAAQQTNTANNSHCCCIESLEIAPRERSPTAEIPNPIESNRMAARPTRCQKGAGDPMDSRLRCLAHRHYDGPSSVRKATIVFCKVSQARAA